MRHVVPVFLFLASATLAGCGGSSSNTPPSPPPPPPSNTATVDFGSSNQTIRGFGGADAWMPAMPASEANALFGTGSGEIGLSILRVRIDPSSTTTPNPQWATELASAQAAIAAGSNVSVIATPWTPPAAWKSNNDINNGGSLNTGNYGDYANYLESFVDYMSAGGVNLYGISMQNEPDYSATYESCVWTGAQMDAWVASLNPNPLTTKLIMPESAGFNTSLSDPALADPSAVGNIGIIGGHLYGSSPSYYSNAENAGKEVWMTEHYLSAAGAQPAIGDALQAAKEIHDSLTVGNYNAYVWWWVIDWNPGGGMTNTGLVDANNAPTYFGWAMAQFSRFVRPGYVRSNATYDPSKNVFVSAYKGNGHFVIVAINMSTSSVNQTVNIQNQSLSSMTPYQTTATVTLAQQTGVTVSGNQFTTVLPAQSITTFVQ